MSIFVNAPQGGGLVIKDATATASDIASGKVAYNNDGRVVGTGLMSTKGSVTFTAGKSTTNTATVSNVPKLILAYNSSGDNTSQHFMYSYKEDNTNPLFKVIKNKFQLPTNLKFARIKCKGNNTYVPLYVDSGFSAAFRLDTAGTTVFIHNEFKMLYEIGEKSATTAESVTVEYWT